ncbi:hypothetical protein CQ12_11020 [Bradyrhizobium jicamae]|uniref:AAA+ ATPase domain-containing protein n=2 Tax=Bradyrhizobium jicamae TaxID=280332 RepID=A0A0R3MA01_9BRAD|nr:hypothetical protein CQ12_11020 [Bradyrhizobium jicamae]
MVVYSFAGDDPLVCKDYIRERAGLPRWEPARVQARPDPIARMTSRVAQVAPPSKPTAYVYQREDGQPYLRVNRTAAKGFWQEQWDGTAWVKGAPKVKIPYRLPELVAATDAPVLIVEGEKDVDNLLALGFAATTNSGGAEKWTADLNQYLEGRDIYILPDNDEPGVRHAEQVAAALQGVARSIRTLNLPDLPSKGDVSDWLEAGGTADDLTALMRQAPAPEAQPCLVKSSAEFVRGFVPPDYAIDGLVQRRFLYSLTAPTGHGKTAIALLFAASKALGRSIGNREVDPGRVLYLIGENPDDLKMRWIAFAEKMKFDTEAIDVHFVEGVLKLSNTGQRIKTEIERLGGNVDLVIVDTSAAYFEGTEENGNVEAGTHARQMRQILGGLPGGPCVIVLCHPVKSPTQGNLLPRGGGAFIAEVDGNLTCWKTDSLVSLHWQGKFRGPDFAPITFQVETVTSERIRDSKGRLIPTVIAKTLSDNERRAAEASSRSDEDAVLSILADNDHLSLVALANALGWTTHNGEPNKSKVQRLAERLKKAKLVESDRSGLFLSPKGKDEAKRVKTNAALAGATYG